jgi:hypothetical protein
MKRTIAAIIAATSIVNGLTMLTAGATWYALVPGVTETGPYNHHFIQDIGVAFLVSGLALAVRAWKPRYWAAGLAGAGFQAGHALLHLIDILGGHAHEGTFDFYIIIIPAALALYSATPTSEEEHA